jgi:hypothetical protein
LLDESLNEIEELADKMKNVKLLFLIQILRELRELKGLLEIHQQTSIGSLKKMGGEPDEKKK